MRTGRSIGGPEGASRTMGSLGSHGGKSPSRLFRSLALAGLVMALIFGGCEFVERRWLAETDPGTLRVVHLARGLASSLAVAAVVAWALLRTPSIQLPLTLTNRERFKPSMLADADRIRDYARWFITMRWIAVALSGVLLFLGIDVLDWVPASARVPLTSQIAALAACNVLYTVLLWRDRGVRTVLQVQGYTDLAILALLLHFSGGVENPLAMVMVLHVIIGGILLSKGQCYGLAAAGSIVFAFVGWAEWSGFWAHHSLQWLPASESPGTQSHLALQGKPVIGTVLLQAATLGLAAYFVAAMAERLRMHEDRLRALAEEARAEQQLLERALDTTGTALRVLGPDLQPGWTNGLWDRWFGDPACGESPALHRLDGVDSPARGCLQDGEVRATELSLPASACCPPRRNDRQPNECVFRVTTAPLTDPTGRIQQVVELAEDITQEKETQTRMVRASKLAALGELAGQIVHEVNNPVAIISGKARLLLVHHRKEMSSLIALELDKIAELADRVGRLARGLLAAGRPSTATRTRLDLCESVRKSLAVIEGQARRRGVTIRDDLPKTELPVLANAPEMEQVFLNLFLNAIDAMPRGGHLAISGRVVESADRAGGWVGIVVEDTGTGIPPDLVERIFEPFFTTKPEGRGTGLGLSICQGLVRTHRGTIEVTSELGRGTRFAVKLPLAVSTEKAAHG